MTIAMIVGVCLVLSGGPGSPGSLRCEYLTEPVGIDVARPRLSWVLNDPRRGAMQGACRVVVASTREKAEAGAGDVWDSGKVDSDATSHVVYDGPELASGRRVYWRVKMWDKAGGESPWSETASWTVGLLKPEDWGGAQWIGLPAVREPAVAAHNGFHSDFSDRADAERWVAIDLGAVRRIDGVRLWPARPIDWKEDVPGMMFPVRFKVEVADGPGFENARVVVDRTGADEPNPGEKAALYRFAPVEARWVRLTATRLGKRDEGHFALALAEMEALEGERVVSGGAKVEASGAVATNDWSKERLTDGITRSQRGRQAWRGAAVMVRTEFEAAQAPARAVLYATARGVYEFRINGRRVGDHELAPEWTDYRTRIQYQGYDVTELVRAGANAIGATVADGWYAGKLGLFRNEMYGEQLSVLGALRLEFADGTTKLVTTGPAWKGTMEGPVRAADLLDGERHDARRVMQGWDARAFDSAAWKPVNVTPPPPPPAALVAQMNEPIRATGEVKPVSITEPAPGVVVVDFGQNMPGWVRAEVSGAAGSEVVFRFGEVLDEKGRLYTANLRGAKQTDTLVLSGARDVFEPRFTYHGFRYVEITGLPAEGGRAALEGLVARVVHSDSPEAGTFECSNPMLNRLMSNIRWTQYANMMSVPTDCPQRDERLGWMGDAQIFAQTAVFNLDMAAFFSKWATDIRDAQGPEGAYPDFAPIPIGTGGKFMSVPGWGDAGVTVPWCAAVNYDDRRLIEAQYESAKRWIGYIRAKNPGLIWEKARGNDYGDWLNGDTLRLEGFPAKGGEVPKEIFATVNFENSCRLVSRMAAAIGKKEEAEQYRDLADRIRGAFRERFIGADGKMPGDTQAGYALALKYDLAPEGLRARMIAHLLAAIERYSGHLSTGFHSTVPMLDELVRGGHADVAYRLVTSTDFPGWGFMIENGATSMWERWDGFVKGRAERGGFQDPGMNSFNHFAFGAVGEWMFRTIAGLDLDPDHPGWRHFFVRPVPGGGLTWARASYRSMHGTTTVSWKLEGGKFVLDLTVPPNTWATVHVPTGDPSSVTEGGRPVAQAEGVTAGGQTAGAAVLSVRSGTYHFEAKAP